MTRRHCLLGSEPFLRCSGPALSSPDDFSCWVARGWLPLQARERRVLSRCGGRRNDNANGCEQREQRGQLSPRPCACRVIAAQWDILRRWETIASVRAPDRDCPDMQRLPIRKRPGDRPPVQSSEIARQCAAAVGQERSSGKPGGLFLLGRRPMIGWRHRWPRMAGRKISAQPSSQEKLSNSYTADLCP